MSRAPDVQDAFGKAWRASTACAPRSESCVAVYLIERHSALSPWVFWAARIIDLRRTARETGRNPVFCYAPADYELAISALDRKRRTPDPDGPWSYFIPADLSFQFGGVNESQAERVLAFYVDAVITRGVALDLEYASWWTIVLERALVELKTKGSISPP